MRYKIDIRKVPGEYTRDGVTVARTRTEEVPVPVLPRDWQAIALRAAVGVVVVLTLLSIAWSTWSIGELLGGGIGFAVAVIFDMGWVVAIILEYLSRYDPEKRKFPEALGWVLLVATMIAIAWHGIERDSWGMAIVGAFVSFFAKILWLGVMKHVNAELSEDDLAWIAERTSQAHTGAAVAQVRRTAARAETAATIQLLAMEAELNRVREAFGLPDQTPAVAEIVHEKPAEPLPAPSLADMGAPFAIRYVRSTYPEMNEDELADFLNRNGVQTTALEVRRVLAVGVRQLNS